VRSAWAESTRRNVGSKKRDRNTKYHLDLDLQLQSVIAWDYGQRTKLVRVLGSPLHHRVFITVARFNKLDRNNTSVKSP